MVYVHTPIVEVLCLLNMIYLNFNANSLPNGVVLIFCLNKDGPMVLFAQDANINIIRSFRPEDCINVRIVNIRVLLQPGLSFIRRENLYKSGFG